MKKISFKSRFTISMLIIFLLSLLPIGLLLFQNNNQDNNQGVLQLSKQINHLLVAAGRLQNQQVNDSLNIETIWANIRKLDSVYHYNHLPLDEAGEIIISLSRPQSSHDQQEFYLNIFDYPGITNDTLLVNTQVNGWINDALQKYIQEINANQDKTDVVSELSELFYPFFENTESKDDQANNNWLLMGVFVLATIVAIGFLSFDYRKKLTQATEQFNSDLNALAAGNIPENSQILLGKELELGYQAVKKLSGELELIREFALKASQGTFEQLNIFEKQGIVGKAMDEMIESLQKISANEERRRWANEGIASFANILRKYSDDLEKLTHEILVHMIKYINACQGGVFVVNKNNDHEIFLELTACYAYERKKFLEKRLAPGQSMVGQCYLEQKSTYLKNVPDNYIQIKSGMGGANPSNIFIVPLISNDEIYGVIEIASFREITDFQREFIEKNAESIASAIAAVKLNENTKNLLQESQIATEQLRAQEEEMRQNMEELAATQEEMKRRQDELLNNEAKTKLIYENAFDGIIITDSRGAIELFNPACAKIFGFSFDEVKGENVKILMPDEVAQNHDSYLENHQKNGSKGVIGETRILTGKRKNGELFPLRIKLDEAMVNNHKVYILFLEDLSEEESLKQDLKLQNEILETNKYNLLSLINNSEDTIFAVDKNYQILVVNEKLKNKYSQLNIDLQEGQNILELLPEQQMKIWKERYDRGLAGERYTFVEAKQKPDGQEELLEVFITPISDKEGNVYGTSITSRDITSYLQNNDKDADQLAAIQEMVTRLKNEKQSLTEKLKASQPNAQFDAIIKEQITNHEYMLKKLQENQRKLQDAMQDEKYIMKKSTSG